MLDIRRQPPIETRTPVEFDDWTVQGVPLRSLVPDSAGGHPDLRTFMTSEPGYWASAVESLRALLGEDGAAEDVWVRFDDGRVGLLFCSQCGDLDCSTLSAAIEVGAESVTWRDVAYQVGYEPIDLSSQVPFTITFRRGEYEALVRQLLDKWTAVASEEHSGLR